MPPPGVSLANGLFTTAAPPLDGTMGEVWLLAAVGAATALTSSVTDAVLDGTQYLWEAGRLPAGRQLWLEVTCRAVLATGQTLPLGLTVGLFTSAGAAVPEATVSLPPLASSLTTKRLRSARSFALDDATEYVLRYRTTGLLGSALLFSSRLLIR